MRLQWQDSRQNERPGTFRMIEEDRVARMLACGHIDMLAAQVRCDAWHLCTVLGTISRQVGVDKG
jgi:hypothetical protein